MATENNKVTIHNWSNGSLVITETEMTENEIPVLHTTSNDEYVGQPTENPLDE
jgi:hypothetical protein